MFKKCGRISSKRQFLKIFSNNKEKEAVKNFKTVLYGLNYIRFYYFCSNKSRKSKLERVSKVMKASPYSYKQWAEFLNISEKNVRKIIHKKYSYNSN